MFLALNRRLKILKSSLYAFQSMVKEMKQEINVSVTTATPLDDEVINNIKKVLSDSTKKKINLVGVIDKKIELYSIDSLVNGYSRLIPKKVRFIKSDVANFNKISGVLKKNNFDMIIYLAAFTNLRESIKFKNKYINNNFKKFRRMCCG